MLQQLHSSMLAYGASTATGASCWLRRFDEPTDQPISGEATGARLQLSSDSFRHP